VPFPYDVTVRFSDTDAMGHINHARFLSYLEDARIALFTSLADSYGIEGGDLISRGAIVARVECDYVRPLYLRPEPVRVSTWVEKIGRSSFTLAYTIEQDGQIAARATSVIVGYDYAAERTRPLSDVDRDALASVSGPVDP
jgi:acyl-CoA thioester hydrolase